MAQQLTKDVSVYSRLHDRQSRKWWSVSVSVIGPRRVIVTKLVNNSCRNCWIWIYAKTWTKMWLLKQKSSVKELDKVCFDLLVKYVWRLADAWRAHLGVNTRDSRHHTAASGNNLHTLCALFANWCVLKCEISKCDFCSFVGFGAKLKTRFKNIKKRCWQKLVWKC